MTDDAKTSEYGVFWGEDIYAYEGTKTPIIDGILYDKDVLCITAQPGTGKSLLALQLICNLTTGKPFLGIYDIPRPMNVLYIQTEGDRAETIERLHHMNKIVPINNEKWVHMNLAALSFNSDVGLREFIYGADQPNMKYDVVIIDPLYTTVKGSMSDDSVTTDWIRNVRQIRRKYDCTFIVLHHEPKDLYDGGKVIDRGNKHLFGSTFWSAFINNNYKLKSTGPGTVVLDLGKERSGKMIDNVHMKLMEPDPLFFIPEEHTAESTAKVLYFIRLAESWTHMKAIVQLSKLSRATVYRALKELADKLERKVEHGIVYYKAKEVAVEQVSV